MDPRHEEFVKDLVKGKIPEIIFEQMFRESGRYTILHSGYEYTLPELAQYQHLAQIKAVIENIRSAPDFVLISSHENDKGEKEVYLVEVKYRTHPHADDLKKICEETLKTWNHCWLFVASPNGFFFEPCNTVLNKGGYIGELVNEKFVDHGIRDEYLKLLGQLEPRLGI